MSLLLDNRFFALRFYECFTIESGMTKKVLMIIYKEFTLHKAKLLLNVIIMQGSMDKMCKNNNRNLSSLNQRPEVFGIKERSEMK